jgi:hypothetical protein
VKKPELCFTKETDLSTGPSVIFDMFPRTDLRFVLNAVKPREQVENHGRASTQAILLYISPWKLSVI